jgi:hypothetical protein
MKKNFEVEVTRTVTERRKIYVSAENRETAHDAAIEHAEWEKVTSSGRNLPPVIRLSKHPKSISQFMWTWPFNNSPLSIAIVFGNTRLSEPKKTATIGKLRQHSPVLRSCP